MINRVFFLTNGVEPVKDNIYGGCMHDSAIASIHKIHPNYIRTTKHVIAN